MPDVVALIVAAGRGSRFANGASDGAPKQYRALGGLPVLRRAILPFRHHPQVDAVRVVIHPDDGNHYAEATAGLDLLPPVLGGASRQESVRLGLESLSDLKPRRVLIHDAARPFVDGAIITRSLAALDSHAGAIAAVPVTDSLKRGAQGVIAGTVPRADLWRAQTPQSFRFNDILAAHRAAATDRNASDLTDDAAVLEHAGLPVALVTGSEANFKITTEDDLARGERQLAAMLADVRTGTGYDVHAFANDVSGETHIMLCGLPVPYDHPLVGHSDADVGLHAITDALLGTIGNGDIGSHFPPSDPQWRGADSGIFLKHAAGLVTARGGMIGHVDVTFICERPKIGPHREAMRARVAQLLGIALSRVSVKATTTEKLGFLGRGEGIAAQAVATVRLPFTD
jgi:2-C-methyl-D-erythritol 4-phosphate cytidylyltransferase / 2-C-methyl-D-erythritol 2,4-cyclodiphosphate synthase